MEGAGLKETQFWPLQSGSCSASSTCRARELDVALQFLQLRVLWAQARSPLMSRFGL